MQLIKGTLDVLVLKALSWGPLHGFEITCWVEQRSGGLLEIDDGALYQALHRMEARSLVTAEWGVTENNRQARFYRLTSSGRAYLRTEGASLASYARSLMTILAERTA